MKPFATIMIVMEFPEGTKQKQEKHQHHLGACPKHRLLDPTPELLHQNLHCNNTPCSDMHNKLGGSVSQRSGRILQHDSKLKPWWVGKRERQKKLLCIKL